MSAIEQICFTSEVNCLHFSPHMLKGNMCTNCMKDIAKHNSNAVTETDVIKALEYTQKGEKIPSLIFSSDGKLGGLYLGGFKAAMNEEFLKDFNVGGIVNTVGPGLYKLFGKSFEMKYNDVIERSGVACLLMEWEDSIGYSISDDDLEKVIRYIHEYRNQLKSVLVHCAQGKSRSATAIVAYIMVILNLTVAESLAFVKEKRKMAEPNSHFMYLLHQFENSELIKKLRSEVGNKNN